MLRNSACVGVVLMLLQTAAQGVQPAGSTLGWLPDGVIAEEVAADMRINGLATRVQQLLGATSLSQLEAAFVASGRAAAGALPAAPLQGWQLFARQFGRGFQTLQMRSDGRGGVEALLATTDLSVRPRAAAAAPLRLAGVAQITSVVESSDSGTAAVQYVAWSPLPVARLRGLLCARASSEGWRFETCDTPVVDMAKASRSVVMSVLEIPAAARGRTAMRAIVVLNELRLVP